MLILSAKRPNRLYYADGVLDVYQLFMYMDVGTIKKGFLVAKDFSTGATVATQHIKEKHNKEIIFAQHGEFPITNPPNDNEREEYY